MKDMAVSDAIPSKVPELTLLFWIIKIAATTLGETGGDAVSMSMNLGYLVGTAIFAVLFLVAVVVQIRAPPWPISPIARSGSDTPVAPRYCSPC
jgi:uncharacterized membrane-anchored protein